MSLSSPSTWRIFLRTASTIPTILHINGVRSGDVPQALLAGEAQHAAVCRRGRCLPGRRPPDAPHLDLEAIKEEPKQPKYEAGVCASSATSHDATDLGNAT